MSKKRSGFRIVFTVLGMLWKVARGRMAGWLSLSLLLGISGSVTGYLTKVVIDGLTEGNANKALKGGLIFIIASSSSAITMQFSRLLSFDVGDRLEHELQRRLVELVGGQPGLDHLERPEYVDKIQLLRNDFWKITRVMWMLDSIIYMTFGLASALFLLSGIHPALAFFPLLLIPASAIYYKSNKHFYMRWDKVAPEDRLAHHYVELLTEPRFAKEVRVFGLGRTIVDRHRNLTRSYSRHLFRQHLKQTGWGGLSGIMNGVAMSAALFFIGRLAIRGAATPGDVLMGVQVVRMVLGHIEMGADNVAWFALTARAGERFLWMDNYKPAVSIPEKPMPVPARVEHGVTFENVSFTYPGTDRAVLEDLSMFIPSGAVVALVGENGAGKSSLVKLLCRFYDPTEGRILIDGEDLTHFDPDDWRQGVGASFQDFVKYEFLAKESVGIGDLRAEFDPVLVGAAVAVGGADPVIEKLPRGIESQLGRTFSDGTDISEGEWQRVALSRGSMRTSPALLILDEPTASLDAKAEHEVFERFSAFSSARPNQGPITILVSHRFSTVRMADLIVMINEGGLEEIGSHEELIARRGRYAELFTLQASRYD